MRQRRTVLNVEAEAPPPKRPLARHIANVDLFPKPREDYQREQTKAGAMVSLFTVIVIALLILWEGLGYALGRDAYDTDVSIDKGLSDEMPVHFDVLFPAMNCERLSIDILDATGSARFNASGTIHKIPTTYTRARRYKGSLKDLENEMNANAADSKQACRRCPAAAFDEGTAEANGALASRCCNTCESVYELYEELGKEAPDVEYVPQCLWQLAADSPGCNVVGVLHLKKVQVTVLFGPRRTGQKYMIGDVTRLDTSHVVNKLRIGDEDVERFSQHGVAEPLSGHSVESRVYTETRYLVKVVPTTYTWGKQDGVRATTYEYSAQLSSRAIIPGFNGAVPAVVFGFEPTAVQVNNAFRRPPFTHLLVRLCGIVGGLFVVLGFVDRVVARCAAFGSQRE